MSDQHVPLDVAVSRSIPSGSGLQALVIPADIEQPLRVVGIENTSIATQQRLVQGTAQRFALMRPAANLYINEEGHQRRQPVNLRASLLKWLHQDVSFLERLSATAIYGGAAVLGPLQHGQEAGVPADLIDVLAHPGPFRVQVTTLGSPHTWAGNDVVFEDWCAAGVWGFNLASKWVLVNDLRVVPTVAGSQLRAWAAIATQLVQSDFPALRPLEPGQIIACYSIPELAERIGEVLVLTPGTAVHYSDLCLINRANGQERWTGIRDGKTFDLPDLRPHLANGTFADLIRQTLGTPRDHL